MSITTRTTTAAALVVSGLTLAAYPALRPYGPESGMVGAADFGSTAWLAAITVCAVCSTAFALYSVEDRGSWPKTWPAELEPLRKQARTLVGPTVECRHYAIPFAKRDEFEKAAEGMRGQRVQQLKRQRLQLFLDDLRRAAKIEDHRKDINATARRQEA